MSSPVTRYRRYRPLEEPESPGKRQIVQQSWAALGFINSTKEASDIMNENFFQSKEKGQQHLDSPVALIPEAVTPVSVGDVFESSDKTNVSYFYVKDVDLRNQTATGKNGLQLSWSELLNPVRFERVVVGTYVSNAPVAVDEERSRDKLGRPEKVLFSKNDGGKQNFLALIRNHFSEGPIERRAITDSRTVMEADVARQIFLQGCRERCLPPLPILINCDNEEYPTLNIANLSLGRSYVDVIAMSLPAMTFLRCLDFSFNVLDSHGAAVLLSSVAETYLEEVILDRNKIGKGGVRALSHIIKHAPAKVTITPTRNKPVNSYSLPPITSPSKLQIRAVTCALKKISVNDNSLGDHSVGILLKALAASPHSLLTHFCARGNDAGPLTAAILAELIGQKGDNICRLAFIDLSWNNIQTNGAIKIFNAACDNAFLNSLLLDFNGIQDTVLPVLARCCNGKNAVTSISLKNNSLNIEALQHLVKPEQLSKMNIEM